ncbi:MAG: hypothetical protein U9Q37_08430 [Euryarchaeota archaeon]|nr:hypothetical protein [Euryarchaeota archaeon]
MDFLPPPTDDPRTLKARELLDGNESAALVYKTTRAGATTSLCAEIMRRGETFTIVEPTNRINTMTLEKAAALSGTGKTIIPILSNANCIYNKELIDKHPEVARLGILPLNSCKSEDAKTGEEHECPYWNVCPITRPLRQVIGVGGYAITYQKLAALFLSTGETAKEIISTVLATDHLVLDEAHTIAYPNTIAVQAHPEIDMSKYGDLDYPMLPDVVSGFIDILTNASDAIEQIKTNAPEYTDKHLAYPITMDHRILKESKDIAVGISSLVDMMIHRRDYDLIVDDVVMLKDMMLLCAEKNHVVHGIIATKSDGGKKLRIHIKTTDAVFRTTIRRTMAGYLDKTHRTRHVWLTSGTMPDMDGVMPVAAEPLMFGDPLDTNSKFAVIADRWRVSVRTLRNAKRFNQIIDEIRQIVGRFGDKNCAVCVMNKKWHDKVAPELKDYKNLVITWYASDLTVGVESDRRILIAVGLAEKPTNSMDAVALSRVNVGDLTELAHTGDYVAVSDKLRNERVHIDTMQAWSRAKDPGAKDRSVVVALGCRLKDVRKVVTWHINRKLEKIGVKKTSWGSRTLYDVVGGELIGSEIPVIPRGKNDGTNELIEKWLDKGDTTPLTTKTLKDFFERHNGENITIRDIHQKMGLARKGLKEKDVEEFLSKSGYPVNKNAYSISIGKSVNNVNKNTYKDSVNKNTYDTSPLTPQDIRNHYRHPLVAAAIMQHSTIGDSWRCGNHDFYGWWKRVDTETDKLEKLYVLTDHNDYHLLIDKWRTLYWSLNFFEESVKTQQRFKPDKGTKGAIIGEYKTTMAYSLGVDIDHANGSDVFSAKTALETAAAFLIGKLHDIGISKSYDVIFSGGGIYVLIHPEITVCPTPDANRTERERWFYLFAETYNVFINDVQQQFFELHPEYKTLVKFDALNNSKRIFKTLFSIHKKHPFACIPLDKNNPQIDFNAARPPLSDDILKSGIDWLSDHDINEQQALISALSQYEDQVKEPAYYTDTEVTISDTPVNIDDLPPCINAVLNTHQPPSGATRMISFLSAYLGQRGWDRQKALVLVFKTADRFGMDRKMAERYFDDWFSKMHCPSCDTIRITGTHYPKMFMGELKICNPDEQCEHVYNPIRYKQNNGATEIEI